MPAALNIEGAARNGCQIATGIHEIGAERGWGNPLGTSMIDYYSVAAHSFQERLDRIEKDGQKDSPDWHLANGLLRLAQGLQQDYEERQELNKGFARSWDPSEIGSAVGRPTRFLKQPI